MFVVRLNTFGTKKEGNVKSINLDQRSFEWAQWRKNGVGASESGSIAAACGLLKTPAPWMSTIQAMWETKVGLAPYKKSHHAIARGVVYEKDAVARYQSKTNILTSPLCGEMDGHANVIASFDGLSIDQMVILETKIPGQETMDLAELGVVDPVYEPQCAHQCLVAWGHPDLWPQGSEHHYYAYQPETDTGHLVAHPSSKYKLLAEKLFPEIQKFWECVEKRIPPCGDPYLQAAIKYRIAKEAFDVAKALEEAAKEELLKCVPDDAPKSFSGGGVMATKSSRAGTIDYEAFLASIKVDIKVAEEFRGSPSQFTKLTISKKQAPPQMSDAVQLALSLSAPVPETQSVPWTY